MTALQFGQELAVLQIAVAVTDLCVLQWLGRQYAARWDDVIQSRSGWQYLDG